MKLLFEGKFRYLFYCWLVLMTIGVFTNYRLIMILQHKKIERDEQVRVINQRLNTLEEFKVKHENKSQRNDNH